jgi:putative restriction endonuclease
LEKVSLEWHRGALILRASRIKPWRLSDNRERLDSFNGLLLAAHLDAAFDSGFVTFKEDGAIAASSKFPSRTSTLSV